MDDWMYGWMVEVMAMAKAFSMAMCQHCSNYFSTQASNSRAAAALTWSTAAVTAAFLGK